MLQEGPRPRSGGDSLCAYAVAAFAAQVTFAQGTKRRGQRLAAHDRQSFADDEQKSAQDAIGSLGHKLSELGKKLLQVGPSHTCVLLHQPPSFYAMTF